MQDLSLTGVQLSATSLLIPEPPPSLQGTAGLGATPEGAEPHSLLSIKPITLLTKPAEQKAANLKP